MATVSRKVCDLDGRDDGVQTLQIKVGSAQSKELDICERCLNSAKLITAIGASHKPTTGKSPKRFSKTELPPQP